MVPESMRSPLYLTLVLARFDDSDDASPEDRSDPDARSVATVTALRVRLAKRPPAGSGGARRPWLFGAGAAVIVAALIAYLIFPSGQADGPGPGGPAATSAQREMASSARGPATTPAARQEAATAAPAPTPPAAPPAPEVQEKPALQAPETGPAPASPQPAPALDIAPATPPAPPKVEKIPPQSAEGLKLVDLVVCREVSGRRSVGPQTYFRYGQSVKPHVWMTVYARKPPRKLTHVYFQDGRRHIAVPLAIRHPRTRTWSRLTIDSAKFAGSWRVAVVTENGEQLGEVFFEVGP
jgi:hypothetical protein